MLISFRKCSIQNTVTTKTKVQEQDGITKKKEELTVTHQIQVDYNCTAPTECAHL